MNEELIIYYKGKPVSALNAHLLDFNKAWDNLEAIKAKHVERINLEEEMEATDEVGLLTLFNELYTLIEFELQDLWNFPRGVEFHRWWIRPKCLCPDMDNEDWYGCKGGRFVIRLDCPLHGGV